MPVDRKLLGLLLLLFALSGLAGLIYQSVWSHYLGLTLGHAAYAQSLVLGIFMGGMALGAWWASRASLRWQSVLRGYAVAELAIGLAGLCFHGVFVAYTDVSQAKVLPALGPSAAHAYQWVTATLLILPQCVLLGMTFPLMSAGALRLNAGGDGEVLGGLYFSNSIGAVAGALLATFVLLPAVGMPGAMLAAGALNLLVAAISWRLAGRLGPVAAAAPTPRDAGAGRDGRLVRIVLLAAAITGATSFVYEIVWVRLLNQALGTTLHSFELMLAAFILGLALGGWWIRKQGARIKDAIKYAGIAQVLMGIAALASAPVFTQSFHWVGWLASNLPKTGEGYLLFNLGSAAIALVVMLPAAAFAGMTLPLFTMALLRQGEGEQAIGRVYAANTVGAILGVLAAVHLLVPAIGLHLSLVLAGLADLLLGFFLLRFLVEGGAGRAAAGLGMASLATLVVAMTLGRPDPVAQASGVFRTGTIIDPGTASVVFLKDGKTSTINVLHYPASESATIGTNGKPDAGMTLRMEVAPLPDEVTMIMAGALPLAMHPAPREVGIIGWGSGLTTHTVLGGKVVERVDSVEIEPAMVEGARAFGERVGRAYADPRSKILYEDARTYFATGGKKYDVIISEPSNPWVSGVASLFTEEFYGFLKAHLNEGGLVVQWIQAYEMSDALFSTLVSAMLKEFPETQVFVTNEFDLLFIGSKGGAPGFDLGRLGEGPLRDELSRVGLANEADFRLRRIGGGEVLASMVRLTGAKGHSDFHPVVALKAPRSRFIGERSELLQNLVICGLPLLDVIDGRRPPSLADGVTPAQASLFYRAQAEARLVAGSLSASSVGNLPDGWNDEFRKVMARLLELSKQPLQEAQIEEWSRLAAIAARASIGLLPAEDLQQAWISPAWLAPGQPEQVQLAMSAYQAAAMRDPGRMRASASALLDREGMRLGHGMMEQIQVIAMIGAAGEGDRAGVAAIEDRHGHRWKEAPRFFQARSFLLAWADR